MSKIALSTETCARCKHVWTQNIYESVNVTRDPGLKQLAVTGDLFRVKCPECGHITPRPHSCVYHDMEKKLMIALTNAPGERDATGFEQYHLRLTAQVPDFIEKVLIFEAGLNDAVVELCKIVLSQEESGKGAQLRFQALDDTGALAFAALRPATRPEFVTVNRDYYEAMRTKAFVPIATKAETRGVWLRVDLAFVGRALPSTEQP